MTGPPKLREACLRLLSTALTPAYAPVGGALLASLAALPPSLQADLLTLLAGWRLLTDDVLAALTPAPPADAAVPVVPLAGCGLLSGAAVVRYHLAFPPERRAALDLSGLPALADADVIALAHGGVKALDVSGCPRVTGAALAAAAAAAPALESLSAAGCWRVAAVPARPRLKALCLAGCWQVGAAGGLWAMLAAHAQTLELLHLGDLFLYDPEGLDAAAVVLLPRLAELRASGAYERTFPLQALLLQGPPRAPARPPLRALRLDGTAAAFRNGWDGPPFEWRDHAVPAGLATLDLRGPHHDWRPVGLARAAALGSLEELRLEGAAEVGDVLRALGAGAAPRLRELELASCKLTDKELAPVALACARLTRLSLNGCRTRYFFVVWNEGVDEELLAARADGRRPSLGDAAVEGFTALRALDLAGLPVTDVALAALSGLVSLRLAGCTGVSDAGVWEALHQSPDIADLDLGGCTQLTAAAVAGAAPCPARVVLPHTAVAQRTLDWLAGRAGPRAAAGSLRRGLGGPLGGSPVRELELGLPAWEGVDAALAALVAACPLLETLRLHAAAAGCDAGGEALAAVIEAHCRLLKVVAIVGSAAPCDAAARALLRLPLLEELSLRGCGRVTDAALEGAEPAPGAPPPPLLRVLDLEATLVTDAAALAAVRAFPNLESLSLRHCARVGNGALDALAPAAPAAAAAAANLRSLLLGGTRVGLPIDGEPAPGRWPLAAGRIWRGEALQGAVPAALRLLEAPRLAKQWAGGVLGRPLLARPPWGGEALRFADVQVSFKD